MNRLKLKYTHFIQIILVIFVFLGENGHTQGKWDNWKYRLPIKLTHRSGKTSGIVPVDVTFSMFAEQCPNPEREIRLIIKTPNGEKEIPFQLSMLSRWTKDTDGSKSRATLNGTITFFDDAQGDSDAEYFLLYGNPKAAAPSYPSDLKVSGDGPSWTVENSRITVKLHTSGQIASVTLKAKPEVPITPQTGIMHWNPGVYIPTRYWAHSFAWDPPEVCEVEKGPLFVEIRRSGIFPDIPEIHLSVIYRIFTGRTYVESGTVMKVQDDIGVVALRNDELVFDSGFFTHAAWSKNNMTIKKQLKDYEPVNRHGDILRIPDTTSFVTLFNPSRGIGAASIRAAYSNIGPAGKTPVLFDNATYITNGKLQYWFRPLVYFHVEWSRQQLITVPKGSVYTERNLYLFYETGTRDSIEDVISLSQAVKSPAGIHIGEYLLPPEE